LYWRLRMQSVRSRLGIKSASRTSETREQIRKPYVRDSGANPQAVRPRLGGANPQAVRPRLGSKSASRTFETRDQICKPYVRDSGANMQAVRSRLGSKSASRTFETRGANLQAVRPRLGSKSASRTFETRGANPQSRQIDKLYPLVYLMVSIKEIGYPLTNLSRIMSEVYSRGLHPRSAPEVCTRGLHPRSAPEVCTRGLHPRSAPEVCTRGLHPRNAGTRGRHFLGAASGVVSGILSLDFRLIFFAKDIIYLVLVIDDIGYFKKDKCLVADLLKISTL